MSTLSKLMKLTGRRTLPVSIHGFSNLHVRSLSEGERAIVEEYAAGDSGRRRKLKRVILVLSLIEIDPNTKETAILFPFDTEEQLIAHVDALAELDGSIVDTVVTESMKLNKISETDVAALLGELAAS